MENRILDNIIPVLHSSPLVLKMKPKEEGIRWRFKRIVYKTGRVIGKEFNYVKNRITDGKNGRKRKLKKKLKDIFKVFSLKTDGEGIPRG